MKEAPSSSGGARFAVGIGLASASLLLLEVAATRLMSFVSWHHFAFMVVSVAMLGLGAASVALSLSRRLQSMALDRLCSLSATSLALSVPVAYAVLVQARFSPAMLASDLSGQMLRLAATYTALLLPFLSGGVLVAACLTRNPGQVSRMYGADLLGAAAGCLGAIVLAGPLATEHIILVTAVLAGVAAFSFGLRIPRLRATAAIVVAGLLAFGFQVPGQLPPRAAPGKTLQFLLEEVTPRGTVLATRNTPIGRVDVVRGGAPSGWSQNPRAPEEAAPPEQLHVLIDGEADTPVAQVGPDAPEGLDYLDYLPSSFAFAARRPERVLIIGAGGGQDVLSALRHGARRVDAVEVNPAIVDLMQGELLEGSGGLYRREGVELIQAEGRSYVRTVPETYDVVELGLVDTWAATSTGGLSLTENFLYTVDAFEDYLAALRPGGMVSVTRWLHMPPRETLRLAGLAAAALENRGVEDPGQHMVVVGVGRVGALVVSRDPFTAADLRRMGGLARERRLDVHWSPGVPWPEDNAFASMLGAESLAGFAASYPFEITPVGDDRPFYFDFNTRRDQSPLALLSDPRRAALSGSATILAVLLQAGFLALLLLVVPVVARRVPVGRRDVPVLGYFLLTGTAFMFVEVPLLQRLTLLVGHPSHAVALVLGVLLASGGVGALWSRRLIRGSRRRVAVALVVLAALVAVMALGGRWISDLGLALPGFGRALLAGLLVAPLGVLMGMPTPYALRAVGEGGRTAILPVLWAATSLASVLGSILSVAVSMQVGFGGAMLIGAGCYACAAALAPGQSRAPAR